MKSIVDQWSKGISPVFRKIINANTKILGSKINALVLKIDNENALGDQDTSITSSKEISAFIKYPGEVTIFRNRNTNGSIPNDKAIFLEDILPVELIVPFEKRYYTNEEFSIEEFDILVHILKDEQDNKIVQTFRISRALGSFNIKNLIYKKFILSNIRDISNPDILTAISNYVATHE